MTSREHLEPSERLVEETEELLDERERMIQDQLVRRGIADPLVLAAFREVRREAFVAPELRDKAYRDSPLRIGEAQTISQPYIVALTAEALGPLTEQRLLEVGTGSGYAAAVLSRLAKRVYGIERHEVLASAARERLAQLGYDNVRVRHGDGTLGWSEHAPYDAIVVSAAAPEVPAALLDQLAPRGRMIIPLENGESRQVLLRITREGETFREEPLTGVRFVPLIGEHGWRPQARVLGAAGKGTRGSALAALLREEAQPLSRGSASLALDALLERVGDARIVLLGEATHGSHEFYQMRARITRALIERKGFDFVAVEADWPDAERIDEHVLGVPPRSSISFTPFARFPSWMWRNKEVAEFVAWLRQYNAQQHDPHSRVAFHGLDLYSLSTSIDAVLAYLDDVDPGAARLARARYGLLWPWDQDGVGYGRAVLAGRIESVEQEVVHMLQDLLRRRLDYAQHDGARFFDAVQNARVVANAERYYRAMYHASPASWNLRDSHMFDTLQALLGYHGPDARGVVWEHNSHVGDATATEMNNRGELNVGQLCRSNYGQTSYIIGFGTDHGSVAAASEWGGAMEKKLIRPAHADSYERLCHDAGLRAFLVHLRDPARLALHDELAQPRLERAIGVVYRPETELASHYFYASLANQFDEYVWFDETRPIEALAELGRPSPDLPETYPFGL